MKYNIYLDKEKEKLCKRLRELEEEIIILKKSIELDRKKSKLSIKSKKIKRSMPAPPISSASKKPSAHSPSYSNPFASKNRKILDNLSSSYELKLGSQHNDADYQRNKAIIMIIIVSMLIIWLIYSMTH